MVSDDQICKAALELAVHISSMVMFSPETPGACESSEEYETKLMELRRKVWDYCHTRSQELHNSTSILPPREFAENTEAVPNPASFQYEDVEDANEVITRFCYELRANQDPGKYERVELFKSFLTTIRMPKLRGDSGTI